MSKTQNEQYLLYQEALKCLTPKQQIFVEVYDNNATKAAESAGYKGDFKLWQGQGYENLRKPKIQKALQLRGPLPVRKDQYETNLVKIANRQDRQRFWTGVMLDDENGMQFRLKASELLGRSNADFVEKVQLDINHTFSVAQAIEQADVKAVEAIECDDDVLDVEQLPSPE